MDPTSHQPASSKRHQRLRRACGWFGAAMVVLGLLASSAGKLWPPRELPQHVLSPILALELLRVEERDRVEDFIRDRDEVQLVREGLRPREERKWLTRAVWIDFFFIGAYALFLVLFGAFTLSRGVGPIRKVLAVLVMIGALIGAAFDVVENLRILRILNHDLSVVPRVPSLIKWGALFAVAGVMGILTIGRGFATLRGWIGYLSAIAGFVAAGFGLFGVYHGNDKLIETNAGRLAVAWLLALIFVTTERTLRDGLQAALDRLATWPVLDRIATWPATDRDKSASKPFRKPDYRRDWCGE